MLGCWNGNGDTEAPPWLVPVLRTDTLWLAGALFVYSCSSREGLLFCSLEWLLVGN
jgi:hypothetical protein